MNRPSRSYTGSIKRSDTRRKLLIIDDDRAFVVLAAAILRDAGYMVLESYDAMQGFMYAQHDPPDLILLDMLMPAGGGMNVLEKLKTVPHLATIPVVVVTASTDDDLEETVKKAGAVNLLRKPLDRDGMLALVRQVIDSPASE
ncbi:MAG TPA: response regulator [Gemmatimonadales bacterium]|nr:response regulator [Gemmatimonadales bacterium]